MFTATALPFHDDLSVDFDAYGEHVAWLAAYGTHGVAPNGSLGEYQTLSDEERAQVVRTLRHELAHHLGWGERGVRELGL